MIFHQNIYLFITFHRSTLGYNNLKDIQIVILYCIVLYCMYSSFLKSLQGIHLPDIELVIYRNNNRKLWITIIVKSYSYITRNTITYITKVSGFMSSWQSFQNMTKCMKCIWCIINYSMAVCHVILISHII